MLPKIDPTQTAAWSALEEHAEDISNMHLLELFDENPNRAQEYSLSAASLWVDFSKNHMNAETLLLLYKWADECELQNGIEAMYAGAHINETEDRAVMHMALRNVVNTPVYIDGEDVMPKVNAELQKMEQLVTQIHSGTWKGHTGQSIKSIVNIGIGGSDLGPCMVVEALKPYAVAHIQSYFVSNIDGSHLEDVMKVVDPATTLFIIASKSFTTAETMTNAATAKTWMLNHGVSEADIAKHFVAISTNAAGVKSFGIGDDQMYQFWNWVGGRFSLSSAIGLSIMCAVGVDHFHALRAGMHDMDQHFRLTPAERNVPITLALISLWYINFFGIETEVILPYDQHLKLLPAYLQQAAMESNGKSVDRSGQPIEYDTDSILWGQAGTNGQHAFYQLLHQGTRLVHADFIAAAQAHHDFQVHQDMLLANCIAQSEALMRGKTEDEVIDELNANGMTEDEIDFHTSFRVFEGNRPSNTIMMKKLTPKALGSLIAMYEQKIFVKGLIWNIFSFDQWGVQLGKVLAKDILKEIESQAVGQHDPSTQAILNQYLQWR